MSTKYNVIGVMSGTSLDGLDLALCSFVLHGGQWSFSIERAETIKYSEEWRNNLANAQHLSAYDFVALHRKYGCYIGDELLKFGVGGVDFIASHGHTVFHEPQHNVCFQIGCGAQIAAVTGLKVISDFRTLDIALGGHGAPLVPIGDALLFADYDACINLGGFANISFSKNDERLAFDICPVNIVLNELLSTYFNMPYDKDGEIGRKGKVHQSLLSRLNAIAFYSEDAPKSLAREWVEKEFNPILKEFSELSELDIVTTCYAHMAYQLAEVININKLTHVLFTGGGAFNTFMMEQIQELTTAQIRVPESEIIDFKEALIFAFLGVLRQRGEVNCLKSVTGASRNNIGGSTFQ